MGKLEGKIALVAGGTGGVGEGIVRAFLSEGATVVVPSRTQEKLDSLHGYLEDLATERLIPIVGDMSNVESAENLRDRVLEKVRRLDAVVASLNGRWNEDIPLTKTPLDEWKRMLDSNLTSHFIAAQTFLTLLERGSTYTLMGGAAAEQAMPNYGLVYIPAAGQLMLTQVLVEENKGSGVRINEVVLYSYIATRDRPSDGHPEWLTADEVGKYTAWLASDEASSAKVGSVMITFVNVFTVLPEKQQDALSAITSLSFANARVYMEAVKHQPGFIRAKLLKSDDGNRVTAIAQWESKQHLQAMRTTPEFKNMQDRKFHEAIVSNDGHIYNTAVEIENSQ